MRGARLCVRVAAGPPGRQRRRAGAPGHSGSREAAATEGPRARSRGAWPGVAVRGRTAPARRSALPKQPKAPSRDARPCPALLLPLRDGTSPAPPSRSPSPCRGGRSSCPGSTSSAAPRVCAVPGRARPRACAPPAAGSPRPPGPCARCYRRKRLRGRSRGALSEPARVVAPLLGHALPRRRRAGRPRSPRRAPPTARDGAGRPAIPTHAPAGSRRTSLPRWRPPESAAAAARGCCCRRTGSRSHGTDRRRRRRARGNPTSCCRRRPPRCRTSRRASAVAEGCPRPDPRSRRAAARRSAPPWRAPGGTAREERPQPLSAHLRRPRPVLWERPPPRPALLRAAPRRGRHSVAVAVPRRAPGRRRWTRNPRAVGGSAGAPVGRAGSC